MSDASVRIRRRLGHVGGLTGWVYTSTGTGTNVDAFYGSLVDGFLFGFVDLVADDVGQFFPLPCICV